VNTISAIVVLSNTNTHEADIQGSNYILVVKFKDFSRTFNDPKVAFSRTNFRRSLQHVPYYSNIIYFFDYSNSFINKSRVRQNTRQICK